MRRWDLNQVEESRRKGRDSFRTRIKQHTADLQKMISAGANVLVAHTMASGVPRAKIILPVMNRVFKGHGDRYASSREFWENPLGRLASQSFMDVTANSFADLIELTQGLRDQVKKRRRRDFVRRFWLPWHRNPDGQRVLLAILLALLQGFAKMELENVAVRASKDGVKACVFNAPEILTNSSSIFLGVEVALYPLLGAFRREAPDHPVTKKLEAECNSLLKPEHNLDEILDMTVQILPQRYHPEEVVGLSRVAAAQWS